jgi:hypothetical protein
MKQTDNLNLVRKIAWEFHLSTGLDWEDLFSEASVAYVEAIRAHDPTRSSVTTFIWWSVCSHLKNYLKKENKYRDFTVFYDTYFDDSAEGISEDRLLSSLVNHIDRAIDESDFFDSLSQEATDVARVVLKNIDTLIVQSPEDAKQSIAHLMTEGGSSWRQVWKGIRDLKTAFI